MVFNLPSDVDALRVLESCLVEHVLLCAFCIVRSLVIIKKGAENTILLPSLLGSQHMGTHFAFGALSAAFVQRAQAAGLVEVFVVKMMAPSNRNVPQVRPARAGHDGDPSKWCAAFSWCLCFQFSPVFDDALGVCVAFWFV
jgi:hypothetical protein